MDNKGSKQLTEIIERKLVYFSKYGNLFSYYDFDGILVPKNTNITTRKELTPKNSKIECSFHENRMDALYVGVLFKLKNGSDFSNYKSSPYKQYYLERLQKENPEFLI